MPTETCQDGDMETTSCDHCNAEMTPGEDDSTVQHDETTGHDFNVCADCLSQPY